MLYKEIKAFKKTKPQMFCTPGHKGKMPRFFPAELDITELPFSDNLYKPEGIIREAQKRAAGIFGAGELLFLTSGATQGIFAMLGAFKNKRVMFSRNSHKSVFEACQLWNIEPVFEGETGATAARLVTYPDYYGNTIDLKSIYADCKEKGIFLLADAAHGSHFGFSRHLPDSAVKYSDCCVLSAHKTLPVLTQGAYLCLNNPKLHGSIKNTYRSMGTTSPSYPILASLDFAAEYLKTRGEKSFEELFSAVQNFKAKLPPEIKICETGDFTRLTLDVSELGVSGFEAEKFLNSCGVYPEFSDFYRVVFILSVCDSPSALRRLLSKIKVLRVHCLERGGIQKGEDETVPVIPVPERAMPFLEAGAAGKEYVNLSAAAGRVSAGEIGFYPPATPLVIRGEVISAATCGIMNVYKDRLFGLSDGKAAVVK